MGYDKDELIQIAKEVISKKKPVFVEELIAYMPCSKGTFYNHGLHELDEIKEAIYKSKELAKADLRGKWAKGNGQATQIALYKLYANEAELRALNGEMKTEVNVTNNGPIKTIYELDEEE